MAQLGNVTAVYSCIINGLTLKFKNMYTVSKWGLLWPFIKKWREGKSQQNLSKFSAKSQQNPSKILAKSQQNFEVHCVQEGFALAIYQEVERREIETLLAL